MRRSAPGDVSWRARNGFITEPLARGHHGDGTWPGMRMRSCLACRADPKLSIRFLPPLTPHGPSLLQVWRSAIGIRFARLMERVQNPY